MSTFTAPHVALEQRAAIETSSGPIEGDLVLPAAARGVVVFAHGSGSSRHSPRNRLVAQSLQERGCGTLLLDLLTAQEEHTDAATAEHRFDIGLLAKRLSAATDWLASQRAARDLTVGYFGASTGAAAALMAAAQRREIAAVVSRGGRPDLAGGALRLVTAPTLLIVGSRDYQVLQLNRQARRHMERCVDKELAIVPGATHLFEEPGALEQVAQLATDWFGRFFGVARGGQSERTPNNR